MRWWAGTATLSRPTGIALNDGYLHNRYRVLRRVREYRAGRGRAASSWDRALAAGHAAAPPQQDRPVLRRAVPADRGVVPAGARLLARHRPHRPGDREHRWAEQQVPADVRHRHRDPGGTDLDRAVLLRRRPQWP